MFGPDAIVHICTYYDSANRTQKILIAYIAANYCCRAVKILTTGDTKHSLNPFVSNFSDIFYFNLASVSDSSRPVMINNTNSVSNPYI